jgi:hypothetical protein
LRQRFPAVHLGEDFAVEFVYRVRKPIDRSWKIFVHADGAHGRLNVDHDPAGGRCPMAVWQPGDYVVDRFAARFDRDYEPGEYTIWTGFFLGWAGRWVNMPVTQAPSDGSDRMNRVKVGVINVLPP